MKKKFYRTKEYTKLKILASATEAIQLKLINRCQVTWQSVTPWICHCSDRQILPAEIHVYEEESDVDLACLKTSISDNRIIFFFFVKL